MKNILKSNYYHTLKHQILKHQIEGKNLIGICRQAFEFANFNFN